MNQQSGEQTRRRQRNYYQVMQQLKFLEREEEAEEEMVWAMGEDDTKVVAKYSQTPPNYIFSNQIQQQIHFASNHKFWVEMGWRIPLRDLKCFFFTN